MIDKAQQEFEAHCSEYLDMSVHLAPAQAEYWKAFNAEQVEHKKKNAGQRALNVYLLNELKKIGWQSWRKGANGNKPKQQITKQNVSDVVKNADISAVAYKGNGSRPANLKINL